MSAPRLEARSIRVERGAHTLLDLESLALSGGETLAVVGPNGAGKTTLLLVLAHVERPSAGDVLWDGSPVRTARQMLAARRRTAAVLQQPLLFDRNVFENVAAGLRFRSLPKTSIRERTTGALESLGISALARREARTLSGGEAQRVSLARAFALHPEVLLLDEPFSALDPPTRHDLLGDLERNLRASGAATLLTTHDLDDALALADRILVLNKGRVAQCDTPRNILNRPANAFVARLVGMDNLLEAKILGPNGTGVIADWAGVQLRVASSTALAGPVLLGIRPERVRLCPPDGAALTQATVRSVTPTASGARVVLDCGIVALELGASRRSQGDRIGVDFAPDAVHVMTTG